MNSMNAIEVKDVSKTFTIKYTTFYGGIAKSGTKQVLQNLSFDVKKGEVIGLIGKNGSGKSTLLKILTNIMDPDSGTIQINGKVASILELGMGFDSEVSGRDNIRMKCGLYGLSNAEIESSMDEIILFSELGEQIDCPLRTYSSGMVAKLAFSVLMHVKSDILIIDEILSVGDASFNSKCRMAFQKMRATGRSIILASHNISTLEDMCDRVLWIDEGKVRESGDPIVVCHKYQSDLVNSIDTVEKLAESGDVISMNRAGIMYRDGVGIGKNLEKAESFFHKAADLGLAEAQINYAELKKLQGDIVVSRLYYEKASQTGNPIAIIALMQMNEDSEIKNSLVDEIRSLANSGNSRAMKLLADMLFNGNNITKDLTESVYWYNKCAELFDGHAEYQLGICYRDGLGVDKNSIKSVEFFEKSSEHGFARSRTELANMYRKGIGVSRDMTLALKWYEVAANAGDVGSMLQIGLIYRDGLGVDVNTTLSEKWLKLYSQQSIASIELTLGDIIRQGFSGKKRLECLKWYSDSAKKGNVNATFNVANLYQNLAFVVADSTISLDYFSKAAEKQNSSALYELGLLYLRGNGVKRDIDKATHYLERASRMRNNRAMSLLALIYQNNPDKKKEYARLMKYLSEYENYLARAELSIDLNE